MALEKITNMIQSADALSDRPISRIHFDGQEEHKTFLGGSFTICIFILVFIIFLITAVPIIKMEKPYNQEVFGLLDSDEEIFYHEAYKILISITDYVKNHELDRSMLDIYVNHFLLEYDEAGEETKTKTRYEVRECKDEDFKTPYEKSYRKWVTYPEYCIDDPDRTLSLLGIRRNMMIGEDTSYF
jgi:hypothetical protein